jgi:Putative Na+/H+ antiporter
MFVVVIMAIASSRPVLDFSERALGLLAALGKRSPLAWWLAVLTAGPLLGSFITEPAAMIICALLLSRQVFDLAPRRAFRYATLGLLFVDISVGGTLTHFAAPPVLMVAGKFGWGMADMLRLFGWKAAIGIAASNLAYAAVFRRDFAELGRRRADNALQAREPREPIPIGVTGVHLAFLAWTVATAHTPALFVGGFLFFLAFSQATAPHQSEANLRSPLLVGFFLAGLVVHGTLQQWWIAPILGRLSPLPLNLGAMVLTAFNDNAAITYLASLVPNLSEAARYAVVAGAVAGGGLTVIANAPNPAGQSVLGRYFPEGISPLGLLLGALFPTIVMSCSFLLL